MVPNGFQKLRKKLGRGTLVASREEALLNVPGDVSTHRMAPASIWSQRNPLDRVPHPN